MKKGEQIFKLIIFFTVFAVITACNAGTMKVSGKVAMVGHDPFGYISIKEKNRVEYRIVGPLEEKLAKEYQGRRITLEGKVTRKAIGPGFPAEFTAVRIHK